MFCEGDVKQAARRVRSAFMKRKRMRHPTYKAQANRYGRIWEKAAIICLEKDIDEEAFVEAQFQAIDDPYPNHLTNRQGALRRYEEYKQGLSDGHKAHGFVDSQMENVLGRARAGADMHRYLSECELDICPAVRYIAAAVLGYTKLVKSMEQAAVEYARRYPDVAQVIRDRFPEISECRNLA